MRTIVTNPMRTGVCLFLSLLCCCGAEAPAADRSGSAQSLSNGTATNDPCSPARAMQTAAVVSEPSQNPTPSLAGLMARARSQSDGSLAATEYGEPLTLELWSSRIAAPDPGEDAQTRLALRRLIRQVRSMTSDDKPSAPPFVPPVESQEMGQPPSPVAAAAYPETVETPQPRPVDPATAETGSRLSPRAQKILTSLRQDPSRTDDPLEAAELLFLSGRTAEAAPFYDEALRRLRPGDTASAGDRAWILFQLGNCLRETDAARAQEAYSKLIAEYPESPWTEIAKANGRLLTWYQSTRPDQLIVPEKP